MSPSPAITPDALRDPAKGDRPKFSDDVAVPVQVHIWLRWLRGAAASARSKPPERHTVHLSADGAEELAALLERLATARTP